MTDDCLVWQVSSYTGAQGNCVEVAKLPRGGRKVRDTKDREGTVLEFASEAWASFLADLRER